jgi:hypothetical protein
MICVFLLMNLIKMIYLTIYKIEHLIMLNEKLTTLVKMANGLQSNETFNQVENKMTCLVKMTNDFSVKLNNPC